MSDLPHELDQKCADWLRQEKGIEMTPSQVRATSTRAFARIRRFMRMKGHEVPDTDSGLIALIQEAQREHAIAEAFKPLTDEEIDAIEDEPISQAQHDRIWAKLKARIDAIEVPKRPFAVTHEGYVVLRFETESEATRDCLERNIRAKHMKISARYSVQSALSDNEGAHS